MQRVCTLLAGAGLGAGLMYVLDSDLGRRRRALVRDKAVHLAHEACEAADVVARDMRNRAHGLASGDPSVLAGGKRALQNPLRGGWSPSARALMGLLGGGLFLYGLTCSAPTACLLGTAGLALAAEAATNAGIEDLKRLPQRAANMATDLAVQVSDTGSGPGRGAAPRQGATERAGAGV
jgi:hypothetical protein